MHIVILQRLPDDLEKIKAAMEKVCPELVEGTAFFSYLKDAKSCISTKKKFLAKREHKDVLVVTGTMLMDESVPKAINKIIDWNPGAIVVIFSVAVEFIENNKKLQKKINKTIPKHASGEGYAELAEHIKKTHAEKMK